MGRSRYKIFENESEPYYITCTTINWLSLFGFAAAGDILLDSFRFLIRENRIKLYGYVIMENHCILSRQVKIIQKKSVTLNPTQPDPLSIISLPRDLKQY
jgi:hypothetical protein